MEACAVWLGYEAFKGELEALRQPAYITVREPALESLATQEVLQEIALQRRSEGGWFYAVPNPQNLPEYKIQKVSPKEGDIWDQAIDTWKRRLLSAEGEEPEALLLAALDGLRERCPEHIAFHTAVTDYLLEKPERFGAADAGRREQILEELSPRRLNETVYPVISCRQVNQLKSRYQEGKWQVGCIERSLGGFLLVDARELYRNPAVWDELKWKLSEDPFMPQLMLFGPADLYALWRDEEEDFAALFTEVRTFPSLLRACPKNKQRFFAYLEERLGMPAEKAALHFLLAVISGLSHDQLEKGDGFLPGRLTVADPWLQECRWICEEENLSSLTVDVVKTVWQKRRRRLYVLERALHPDRIIRTGRKVGSVYGLAPCDLGFCRVSQLVHVTATPKKEEAKRRRRKEKERLDLLFESEQPLDPDMPGVWAVAMSAALSALSGYGALQSIAVIGHVDAQGVWEVGPEAAELITGFYDICYQQDLENGGVLMPTAGSLNLALPASVRKALQDKSFFLYTARTLMEGAEILLNVEHEKLLHELEKRL